MSEPRVSVVIPARNEASVIGAAIDRAGEEAHGEIIVADGGSTDGTAAVAEARGARVVGSEPGRGRQMNRGAAAATGDVLLFLHADTLLPAGYEKHVVSVLQQDGVSAGAFELSIDAPHRSLRVIERAVNWRSRLLGMPYGDQAIFVEAAMFRRAGGFPDVGAMEDFELVRRLRRSGRVAIAPAQVVTSARRWLGCGVWRTTALNQLCVAAYLMGVPADRIAVWRNMNDGEADEQADPLPEGG
ncbi:MAG: TIGR04283 family arsenosugar biosynthesis glycosyltransferase [Planctomycetota bacterium]